MNASGDSLDRVWIIARRELKALFDHPTGYVLLVVLLAVNNFMFFREAFLMGTASLRPMLDLLPWIFLFFVPAVSMRTIAEETRTGMLEVVLTQPLSEGELVTGKYLGAVLFLCIGLALTLPVPIGLALGSELRWGPVIAQYVGAALLTVGLTGVGVWASTIARSQITAFILALGVTFVLVLIGLDPLLVGLPPTAGAIAARLGVLSHFESIGRGVIDLRDAIYFLSLAGIFLTLSYAALVRRRLSPGRAAAGRLRLGAALLVAVLVVVNLAGGYIGGRLDLTPGRAYTLSPATRQIVSHLDDIVTIKVFASDELPTQVALLKRDMDDLLRDLRSASHGRVRVVRRNPSTDDAAKRDAQALGVTPVQFNVVGQSELQVKEGYLGLAIQYGAGNETIPFVNRGDDLEYRLVGAIRSLTRPKKPVVVVIADQDQNAGQQGGPLESLLEPLNKSYEIRNAAWSDSTQPAKDVTALVIAGSPDTLPPATIQRLRAFFHRGGSALVLAGGSNLQLQVPFASPRTVGVNAVLAPFGVSIKSDVVYDLAANDVVPVGSSMGMQVLERYPFFVHAQSTTKSIVNADLNDLLLPWPSTIDTTHKAAWEITPLFESTKASGSFAEATTLQPARDFPQTRLAPRLLAVQVAPKSAKDTTARGRVIVVGAGELATGGFVQRAPQNGSFILNAIDWLAQDESLIAIRSRNTTPPPLAFQTAALREGVEYFNIIGIPAIVALLGFTHLVRRRRKARGLEARPASHPEEALA